MWFTTPLPMRSLGAIVSTGGRPVTEASLKEKGASGAPETRQRIVALFRPYSLESTTQPRAIDETLAAPLPRGASVYLTSLPGAAREALVEAAARLRTAGLNPVPHLSARSFADAAELDQCLGRLAAEAGVRQALVIGGDIDRPRGAFASSRALIATGLLARHGIEAAGLAAYPDGHPRISGEVLTQELAAKIGLLRGQGIAPYLVTQFCFEAAPIRALLERIAAQFPDVPMHIGLAGPAKLSTLLRYAASCGIGTSLRALRRQASLTRLMTESGPESVIAELAHDSAAGRTITQLHFFTFGGVKRTAQWAQAIASGAFTLLPDGSGLRLDGLVESDDTSHIA